MTQNNHDDLSWARFRAARGELYTAFESKRLLEAKLVDDLAFAAFKKSAFEGPGAATLLLPHIAPAVLASCAIPSTTVGEWFSRVTLGHGVKLGENVNFLAHGGIAIGNDARIGDGAQIITVGHGMHPSQRFLLKCAPVIIEEGALIGSGVLIVHTHAQARPLVIGKGAIILPGSIVAADVPQGSTVGGRPAKPVNESGALIPCWEHAANVGTAGCRQISSIADGRLLFESLRLIPPIHVKNAENIHFGDDCFINRNAILRANGAIRAGDKLQIAPAAVIEAEEGAELHIGDNVWIGAGSSIHVRAGEKLRIGDGAIIAAGAQVTSDVAAMTIVIGKNHAYKKIDDSMIEDVHARWKDPGYVAAAVQKSRAWNREKRSKAGL